MKATDLIAKLDGVTRCGDGWQARCPAHDDKKPSLSVSIGADGRILVTCHAGCTVEGVVGALGLKASDLFPQGDRRQGSGAKRIAACYDYHDEQGKLLFQCVRYAPKDFRQRRPDPARPSEWIWNLQGVRKVLYRLPEVKEAVAEGRTVFIAEGEKDVDALESHGLDATCNPMGAGPGKWLPEHTESLRGAAAVVVVADKDELGRKHARTIASALRGVVPSVKVVEMPDRPETKIKDAHDFFAAGGNVEELKTIVIAAPEFVLNSSIPDPAEPEESGKVEGFILPSGPVSITESATAIFTRIGPEHQIFWHGGALSELVEKDSGPELETLRPEAFRSRVEKFEKLFAWRSGPGGQVLKPAKMSTDDAKAIMATQEARTMLPPISNVLRCPVLTQEEGGEIRILGQGYHPQQGGILITAGGHPPFVELAEAVQFLTRLIEEFDFQSEGDRSRALAAFIVPALRMGGFLNCNVPIDVAEANDSQAGKGYRHNLVCAIYGEEAHSVAVRKGGVGSADESLCAALAKGKPFICLDNLRGSLDSQYLESFLTAPHEFSARIPYSGEIKLNPRRYLLQLSSNGFESTRDLANRSSICRIRKRPGYAYRDTQREVEERQAYYLGCVFAVVREWINQGKPQTTETRHDFRQWCQILDWIVQNIFKAAPLMDGHQAAQERVSNPNLSWLRQLACSVEKFGQLGKGLIASEIVELCERENITVPGLGNANPDVGSRRIGTIMGGLFRDSGSVEVEGILVTRGTRSRRKPSGDLKEAYEYTFTRTPPPTQPPNSTQCQ